MIEDQLAAAITIAAKIRIVRSDDRPEFLD